MPAPSRRKDLTVVAFDNAYAFTRATADVTIEVTRNENGPIFQPSATYQVTVSEELALGALVETVTAVDRDDGVSLTLPCPLRHVEKTLALNSHCSISLTIRACAFICDKNPLVMRHKHSD